MLVIIDMNPYNENYLFHVSLNTESVKSNVCDQSKHNI